MGVDCTPNALVPHAPTPQALAVRASSATSVQLPETLQTLVGAFQAVPDPKAVSRRRGGCRVLRTWRPLAPKSRSRPAGAHTSAPCAAAACTPQRYKQLLFFATKLEPLPAEDHTDANKVKGCVSQARGGAGRRGVQAEGARGCGSGGSAWRSGGKHRAPRAHVSVRRMCPACILAGVGGAGAARGQDLLARRL